MVSLAKTMFKRLKQYKWGTFFEMFYVEPIVFVLFFSHSLSGIIMKNEVIYQACTISFHFNESDCQQLETKNMSSYLQKMEAKIQPYVANLFMIQTLLESIIPAIYGVFVGSWSDHYGRKPLLLVSMIGFSFTYVIAAVICKLSKYYQINPWYYGLAIIPQSFLGGNCVFSVAVFGFISDVTDIKTRPYRMISLETFLSVGHMAGSFLSSFVLAATGATFTFSLSGVLICFATLYIAVYVPESLKYKSKNAQSTSVQMKRVTMMKTLQKPQIQETIENTAVDKDAYYEVDLQKERKVLKNDNLMQKDKFPEEYSSKTSGLFSYEHIKDIWATCIKTRPSYDRSIILLVTGTMFLSIFVFDGATTVFYLFVREKFQWTIKEYTIYETISHVIATFGALIGFLVMRKAVRFSVVTLAAMALLSDVVKSVIQGLAAEPWHLYLAIAAGAFKAIGAPMCGTIVSNIVPGNDLGKIFSINNILQSFAPFLAVPFYTFIYKASLPSYPGFFNFISTFIHIIALIFLLFVLRFKLNDKEHYAQILK